MIAAVAGDVWILASWQLSHGLHAGLAVATVDLTQTAGHWPMLLLVPWLTGSSTVSAPPRHLAVPVMWVRFSQYAGGGSAWLFVDLAPSVCLSATGMRMLAGNLMSNLNGWANLHGTWMLREVWSM